MANLPWNQPPLPHQLHHHPLPPQPPQPLLGMPVSSMPAASSLVTS
jgi:hypothetical protein